MDESAVVAGAFESFYLPLLNMAFCVAKSIQYLWLQCFCIAGARQGSQEMGRMTKLVVEIFSTYFVYEIEVAFYVE
jgi:hypothetical protein